MDKDIAYIKGFIVGFSVACIVTGAVSSLVQYKALGVATNTFKKYLKERLGYNGKNDDILSRIETFFMN
ncbi:Hypothetical protein ORPV_317 [Orpheovirus IHUMI-LCC2]|uniref:Transmembrane protein n=1 Tax=Orpheovirus IHUMI-LCC2 TaxID=2023057 RepID=A0A2I2L3Y5_9VIRU|nr:Hypothetical protein ORPV_317 [Orpheovirus IHUMI-LCC2]SNW62221.1 Hypothetical protein ORPV_317 [Orpheovirus IHUMI-LCC2]